MLTDETIQERKNKILDRMKLRGLEQLVIYGDVEHCGNCEYLVGYFPRFEESLLGRDADLVVMVDCQIPSDDLIVHTL